VAVWSGKIELQSLQLDVHAVNSELSRRAILAPNLACPFKVIEGRFDKVQLDVPWARLTSRPVVFRASGLWVYVEPHDFLAEARNNPNGYTENRYGTKVKSRKSVMQQQQKVQGSKEGVMEERINSIATAEEGRRRMSAMKNFALGGGGQDDGDNEDSEDVGDTNTTSSSSSNNTFTTRLVRRIIENLQVEIQDVHIAIRGCQTAAGIVLGSLSLSTTDAKGNKTFVDRSSASSSSASAMNHHEQVTLSFLYKELLISGFGIYLQRDNEDNNSNGGTLKQRLARVSTNTEYILEPLSFQAKLRQSDLDTCIDFPKYLVHSKLSSLSITVSRNQLELGHQLAMAVVTSQPNSTSTEIRPLFPEYRPLVPVKGNAHKWWKYAVRCIGRLNRHRSWIEFYLAFQKRKRYLELHKRNVYSERRDKKGVVTSSPWLSKLRIEERVELENIERDRSISILGLMHWRNIADAQFVKEKEKYHRIGTVSGSSGGSSISSNAGKKKSSKKSSSFAKTKSSVFGSPAPKRTSSSLSQQDSLGTSELYQELTDDGNNDDDEDDIALTTDEMRELEKNLAMTTIDSTLSKDSMFCDINFTLGSFHVNLIKGPKQPLTSLEMGMVSASFKANADGSFTSGLTVLSLEVLDGVTPATFYPTVCRSLQKGAHSNTSHAFRFQLKKSKVGDQELVLKMVACEIVASPMLLFAVREFFKLPPLTAKYNGNDSNINPYLYQSSSGDEDLFFDAKGVESTVLMPPAVTRNTTTKPQFDFSTHAVALKDGRVSDKVSSAIMDAWNGKNKNRQKWRMDFDISAPILILPENCTDPNATVLICNFGRFNFRYGTDALSSSVTQWFNDRQRPHKMDSEVDHLKLEMNDLFFTISSVGVAKDGLDGANTDVSGSVIQPISFTLDVGLEHTISAGDETPRTCVIGVLPAIILRLAPSHITKMLSVAAIWTSNLHKLRGDVPNDSSQAKLSNVPEELVDEDPDIEIMSSGSGISILDGGDEDEENGAVRTESLLSKKDRLESLILSRQNTDSSTGIEFMHVSVSLLRLSINVYTENGDGLEAHLVSVMASSSLATDGTSSTKLAMGWFWILDQLDSELKLPRRQRLLCHSNLPRPALDYATDDKYSAIMDDLTNQGVFKSDYSGSAELADIHILKLPENKAKSYHDQVSDFSRDYIQSIHEVDKVTVVNAKFTSLFINWNPQAIKTLLLAKNDLTGFKEEAMTTYGQMSMLQQKDGHKTDVRLHTATSKTEKVNSVFILAQMDMFEISLNSAKDDLPLFTLIMSGSKVNHHSLEGNDDNSEMTFTLGDFRMVTPDYSNTLEPYQVLLGLAPSVATSLLTVRYCKGANAVRSCNVGGADKQKCEACAEIVLSPMRFVHVHSQVFTLIEYVTEGVFGALTASVASTAAAAAMEVAKSSQSGQKLFYIVASGFDLVLPQAAYSENYFLFHAGNFQAHYRAFENDVGSEAQVSLKDVSMRCGRNMTMVSTPVNLSVKVQMKPPFAKGTEEELATRIEMSTSRIRILVARCHYSQIMRTLDYNISEQNNFLRGDRSLQPKRAAQTDDKARKGTVDGILKSMGHAGVENVDVIKRMYINFNIQELSVELCGVDTDDPIVSLAAVNTHILTQLLPDEDVTKAYVTLHDLVCDDRRLGSVDRTFRRMIGKATSNRTDLQDSEVFVLNYTKYGADESRDIEVKLGSSQVVVLPDVISDLIAFVKVAPIQGRLETLAGTSLLGRSNEPSTKVISNEDDPEAVEMRYEESSGTEAVVLKKTKYHVESSNMRLVLVDIGSVDASGSFSSSKSASLTETIVVQGKMKATFEKVENEVNDETLQKDYKIDAERVEIYTAQGVDLLHPVQILEPAKFALFYYQDIGNDDSPHVTDIKFVTLSPIEVTFSMQNAALASALATSITDAFGNNDSVNESIDDEFHFPANDANRIARLESALDKDSAVSTAAPSEHGTDLSVHSGNKLSTKAKRRIIRLKSTIPEAATTVTNDFQGLDEALFKIVVMNCVAGGEIDYPSLTSDKPCFGCNMNTSVLADYFDAASCRWETLLVQPWEITFNASRGPQTRTNSKRMSTTFDIESNPCHVSFSEHFLVNVGAASRMWSVYSGATKQATILVEERVKDNSSKRRLSRSMAAHAARSLITTLPYAIENHSGINASYSLYNDPTSFELPTSSTRFFRFELFPEKGSGGVRKYGQDIKHAKSLIIYVGSTKISVPDMDTEASKLRSVHYIADMQTHVFTKVVKRGNSTVLHLSSHVEMHNKSSLPFRISIIGDESIHDLGVVQSSLDERKNGRHDDSKSLLKENEELMTHSVFGLPAPLLRNFATNSTETLCLQVSPILSDGSSGGDLVGMFNLPPLERLVSMASSSDGKRKIIEVTCSPSSREIRASSLTTHISFNVSLIDGDHAFIELSITPRAVLKNKLPVPVLVRTPMPHAFPTCEHHENVQDSNYSTFRLNPLETIEVFTPGPSIAVSMKCADLPIGGTLTGWIDGEWIDVPLGKDKCLPEPVRCTFPYQSKSLDRYRTSRQVAVRGSGSDFYVLEAEHVTPDLKGSLQKHHVAAVAEDVRTVVFVVCAYVIDHTGNLLFEEVILGDQNIQGSSRSINPSSLMGSPPFSAYSSAKHRRRVSLLPGSSNLIRLASLTMDGDEGMKKSVPFRVEDVSMTEGVDATPILWADSTPSGYFAYRNLTAEGSELHVVPEYVIFNGSTHHQICVRQISQPPFLLDPSKISPISRDRNNSIVVQFEIPAINGLTGPVQIDRVGLRVCVAKSRETGEPLGSLAVQTVTGARDSRLVIKIGALNFKEVSDNDRSSGLFAQDYIRCRVRWSEMRITLKDTEEESDKYDENREAIRKYLEHHNVNSAELEKKLSEARHDYNMEVGKKRQAFPDVAEILLHRFTVDFQRIFKEDESKPQAISLPSSERAQFSVVIHNVRIMDCSPNSESPIVFDSMSDKNFIDLCVRTRGPLNADLIRVDLFDVNLAYSEGKAEKIVINTGEDFVWKMLDISHRTMLATAELAGVDLDLRWDEEKGKFSVAISDPRLKDADDIDHDGNYKPPRSDKLYDVKKIRVSPFILLLSFKRQPQSSRYKLVRGGRGAKLTNYFTTRLKFTVTGADLRFKGYMGRDVKGPPDRLFDTVKAVYTAQLKSKMVQLMTATSINDWKYLAARESGSEEFIEGDIFRVTGNLAGRSAKFVLKKSGDYIGDSLVAVTGVIGGGVQEATESVGLGQVGAGVNSVVTGLGVGVSKSVKGVGSGAGDLLRGTGKGIGQAVGGIGGGVQLVAKGIGKGITTGDASAVGEGFATMGQGVGQGVETVVDGAVSGVMSVGKGLFSGVGSITKGIGGVFTPGGDSDKKVPPKNYQRRNR